MHDPAILVKALQLIAELNMLRAGPGLFRALLAPVAVVANMRETWAF